MARKKSTTKKTNSHKPYIKGFWKLFSLGVVTVFGVFLLASIGALGEMPDFRQLENPETNLATQILSSDNQVLGKFYFKDNRTPIQYDELPQNMIDALIATEDERYYDHSGIDLRGTIRAVVFLGKKGGASTISQQLARQLFVGVRSRNMLQAVSQKIKEWVIAIRLERQYTKEEIIMMYLNIYDFGYNADGIRSAASIFFNKEPKELNVQESALLIGMLKNSSLFNPLRRPEMVKQRRNVVLSQMKKNNYLTESQKDSLQKMPLGIDYHPQSHREGLATYFRAYLQKFMKTWLKNNPKPNGEKYDLYMDGLKIYTTLDSKMQRYAEEATKAHMKQLQKEFFRQNQPKYNPTAPFLDIEEEDIENILDLAIRRSERYRKSKLSGKSMEEIIASFDVKTPMTVFSWKGEIDTIMTPLDSIRYYKHFLQAGMMSMEPQTGHVKAWVGGYNYKHFQFDHVMQGKRQIGSTFKPLVYATAIDQLKLSPCDSLPDAIHCIEPMKYGNVDAWCPKNSGERYGGMRTLKNALANSVNTISAQLMDMVGPEPVVNLARDLGITSRIPKVPSIALGTPALSVYEMVGAYGAFVNGGIYVKPTMITRVEDKNGTVLYESTPVTKDVMSAESAYVTTKLLEGVTEHGSGARLRHAGLEKTNPIYRDVVTGYPYQFTNPIAGKTGTTQNQSDGWFMGAVPNLVTGVWVGGEDRATHFETIAYGQGATMALPIWAMYMKQCYEDETLLISQEEFPAPENLTIAIDCDAYKASTEASQQTPQENLEGLGF
ncbi:MAG: transglycosylase domain-containing protein [Flavobacteriaceae bacterium]|nr:transglycosylase domain-containing protein [Flavobacteriaceae bacterium]MDG2314780.1 transglycosylase domain-containing protein [Flavobacteriaceae bacterium]